MAAELVVVPVLGLLFFGWSVFFMSLAMYRRQQREEKFERLLALWQGIFRARTGHSLVIQWHEREGWIVTLRDAEPSTHLAHFRAQLRGDTLTATLGASGIALDLRFIEDSVLASPLVPGLHGDVWVEQDWLAEVLSGKVLRWRRE